MYYPYFRGKQFELIAIRETAELMANSNFVPIIEPVRASLGSLEKALDALCDAGGQAIIVTNPQHGDLKDDGQSITQFLNEKYRDNDAIRSGYLLRSNTTQSTAIARLVDSDDAAPAIIHSGFTEAKALALALSDEIEDTLNIFIEDHAKLLYRRHFNGSTRVLVRDGFNRQKNADYPEIEQFSDLHATYADMNMDGYGDFLTVGDSFSEGGGPAYAVAIHLTFIDPTKEDEMFVYHFVSDSNDTPTDPAGKFGQALEKLMLRFNSGASNLVETSSVKEFQKLHERGHFPGLGYVKKLSIKHHIETLAHFHSRPEAGR